MIPLLSMLTLLACGNEKGAGAGDSGSAGTGGDGTGTGDGTAADGPCPSEVPDEYQYLWDCDTSSCDKSISYHIGEAESFEDGSFSATETYFRFEDEDTYCVDIFQTTGTWLDVNPEAYGGGTTDEVYEVNWELIQDQCGAYWSSAFGGFEWGGGGGSDWGSGDFGPDYAGYLFFQTHTAFGEVNPDGNILVFSARCDSGESGEDCSLNDDYARGNATEDATWVGPPRQYHWASSAICSKY